MEESKHFSDLSQSDVVPSLTNLWILRVLMLLNAHKKLITNYSLDNDEIAIQCGLEQWVNSPSSNFTDDGAHVCRSHLHVQLKKLELTCKNLKPIKNVEENIKVLGELVLLTPTEQLVLTFAVLLHTTPALESVTDYLGDLSTDTMCQNLAVILAVPVKKIYDAFNMQGTLHQSGLIKVDRNRHSLKHKLDLLSAEFADVFMSDNKSPVNFLRGTVDRSSESHLAMVDYAHIEKFINVLNPYFEHVLMSRRKGVNILIYGVPGTGKSQFVKAFSQHLGAELFDVAADDSDGDPIRGNVRLRAFRAAQGLLSNRNAILLFDEVEDVFSDGNSLFGPRSTAQNQKGWMNKLLEENPVPAFWVSNDIDSFDPAFIRRFDLVFELPIPPKNQRIKIIEQTCGALLDMATINRIAESEDLAPAVVARVTSVLHCIQNTIEPKAVQSTFELMLNSTLEAQKHRTIQKFRADKLPDFYDARYVNSDMDLVELMEGIKNEPSARLCLYGPAGTGKTAYGRWLAEQLDKPLHIKKASDLLSMYVGGTEQNMARAFSIAEEEDAVLMIDEVDSFLQDRRNATKSWETTQVNEMLTQIESFSGILIASTNLMDGLDPAAMRRFDLKAMFNYLKPEQSEALLLRHCDVLKLNVPNSQQINRLKRLSVLTLGDFAAVLRQSRFKPIREVDYLIDSLEEECAVKKKTGASIGFVC